MCRVWSLCEKLFQTLPSEDNINLVYFNKPYARHICMYMYISNTMKRVRRTFYSSGHTSKLSYTAASKQLTAHRHAGMVEELVANNYLWACAEDKRTVICNPMLYLSVKFANLAFLWVCFELNRYRNEANIKSRCI